MTTQSEAYQRFLKSLQIDYEKWHDGEGYDLDAMSKLEGDERNEVERLLVDRLRTEPDWREIEALGALNTANARLAIRAALQCNDTKTRLHAAEELMDMGEEVDLDPIILEALRTTGIYGGASYAIDLAEKYPSAAVRKGLLDVALNGDPEVRVNAAALSLFLAGQADEAFDWNHRPFFLRFGEDDPNEVRAAYDELCRRIGEIQETGT